MRILPLPLFVLTACGSTQSTSEEPIPQPATVVAVPSSAAAPEDAGVPLGESQDAADEDAGKEIAVIGSMWGDSIGEAFGAGGLGLSGIATGDAGAVEGGLGTIGLIGRRAGPASSSGLGALLDRPRGRLDTEGSSVVGSLDKDIIRRIVQRNRNRLRFCYERRLSVNPNLQGKVVTRFVIGRNGSVAQVQDAGSTLPDTVVKSCVQGAFRSMVFPQPTGGGIVIVTYPITFQSASAGGTTDAGADAGPDAL